MNEFIFIRGPIQIHIYVYTIFGNTSKTSLLLHNNFLLPHSFTNLLLFVIRQNTRPKKVLNRMLSWIIQIWWLSAMRSSAPLRTNNKEPCKGCLLTWVCWVIIWHMIIVALSYLFVCLFFAFLYIDITL